MTNLQDFIEEKGFFKSFRVNDLLFTEFKCPTEEGKDCIWWQNNFFFYIASGSTELFTPQNRFSFKAGDFAFAKKGSIITQTHHQDVFCELIIFVPDSFIRSVIQKYAIPCSKAGPDWKSDTIIPLFADKVIKTFFQSLSDYFTRPEPPPDALLKLKFEELILYLLSGEEEGPLHSYFMEICRSSKPSIKGIMEANFAHRLSLDEYARLCGRSLSSFKSEFKSVYHTTPGSWLKEKRLEYSRYLLERTDKNVAEVTYESGFENSTHFIRVFKDKFGAPPGKYQTRFHSG